MFFVNGRCLGIAAKELPARVFAVIDLYGQCVQVSIIHRHFPRPMTDEVSELMIKFVKLILNYVIVFIVCLFYIYIKQKSFSHMKAQAPRQGLVLYRYPAMKLLFRSR